MPAKRGTGKAKPPAGAAPIADAPDEAPTAAPAEEEPVAAGTPDSTGAAGAVGAAEKSADEEQGEPAPPEPANRAERRALARGKVPQQATGTVKQYGRSPVGGPPQRRWQGRRGG